jgi:hypothetical protein
LIPKHPDSINQIGIDLWLRTSLKLLHKPDQEMILTNEVTDRNNERKL